MRNKILVLSALVWLTPLSSVNADIVFSYEGDPQGTALPNSTLSVNLFLVETATGGSQSLIASEQGLFGAAVAIVQRSGSGTTISSININGATEPNGFTGNNQTGVNSAHTQAYLSEAINNAYNGSTGPSGTTTGGSVTTVGNTITTKVFLGSVTLNTGPAGSSTTYDIESFKNAPTGFIPGANTFGNTLSITNIYDLDSTNNTAGGGGATYTGAATTGATPLTVSFSSSAVPEPSSMLLCSMAAFGFAYGFYRCRKALALKA